MKRSILIGTSVACVVAFATVATAADVPHGFQVRGVATGFDHARGLDVPMHVDGTPVSNAMYVVDTGAHRVVEIDLRTGDWVDFAFTGTFPVGVACMPGSQFGEVYIGNEGPAYGENECSSWPTSGIVRCESGYVKPYALGNEGIAGLVFGHGPFGDDLYAADPGDGLIWTVDALGDAHLFAKVPGLQPRYLEINHGGPFGNYLYFTEGVTGEIYRVGLDGRVEYFASIPITTGTPVPPAMGLNGLAFSPGGAFGDYLYVGDESGRIYQVDSKGGMHVWAEGFPGVADIVFRPDKAGTVKMYLVDGQGGDIVHERRPTFGTVFEVAPGPD